LKSISSWKHADVVLKEKQNRPDSKKVDIVFTDKDGNQWGVDVVFAKDGEAALERAF